MHHLVQEEKVEGRRERVVNYFKKVSYVVRRVRGWD